MDKLEFVFPRSYSIIDEESLDIGKLHDDPLPPIFNLEQVAEEQAESTPDEPLYPSPLQEPLPSLNLSSTRDVSDLFEKEESLWANHPTTSAFLFKQIPKQVEQPLLDIDHTSLRHIKSLLALEKDSLNESSEPSRPEKDVGITPIISPDQLPQILQSSEQNVLREIKGVIGDRTASEHSLQFAPQWILQKAIDKERNEYRKHVNELDIRTLSREANIISSHHFFQVKHDGHEDSLKLKCRLVPQGSRDKNKESIRSDSSSAQFAVIRIVLSIAAILSLNLATIDIKSAFLQSEDLGRDIYMRPPRGWAFSSKVVWRLLKPAYGFVESGRIWQLTVERWMKSQNLFQIPGLQQLFIQRDENSCVILAVAKVVDDFLIAGISSAIQKFHKEISRRFTVDRFLFGQALIFNRLHIRQEEDFSVYVNMKEYLQTIQPLEIPHLRRKEHNSKCKKEEVSNFLGLTGSLNYLGHGILPQASFPASHLQQMVGRLTVSCMVTANKTLARIKSLDPSLVYRFPRLLLDFPSYLAFSDASQSRGAYGQTDYISGVYLSAGGERIYHVIDWLSCK